MSLLVIVYIYCVLFKKYTIIIYLSHYPEIYLIYDCISSHAQFGTQHYVHSYCGRRAFLLLSFDLLASNDFDGNLVTPQRLCTVHFSLSKMTICGSRKRRLVSKAVRGKRAIAKKLLETII